MNLVHDRKVYGRLAWVTSAVALACLTWWLVEGGPRGAEIAGDLAAVAGLVAAGAAVWPLLAWARTGEKRSNAIADLLGAKIGTNSSVSETGKFTRLQSIRNGAAQPLLVSGNIGLWGPVASGKTCFLAALNTAVAQATPPWTVVGADSDITDVLSMYTTMMVGQRRFPPKTSGINQVRVIMATEIEILKRRGLSQQRELLPVQFDLSVLDVGGEEFNDQNMAVEGEFYSHYLVNELVKCDGIVLFFDSTEEREVGDTYEIFQNGAARLEHELRLNGGLNGNRLPHHVAVCISKFDEPDVLDAARKGGHLIVNEDDKFLSPRVANDRAELLFEELCKKSSDGNAALLNHAIKRYFHASRVRYFAVSAVGFYVNPGMTFNAADCYNLEIDGRDGPRIRSDIHPINVIEPLLWLGTRRRL